MLARQLRRALLIQAGVIIAIAAILSSRGYGLGQGAAVAVLILFAIHAGFDVLKVVVASRCAEPSLAPAVPLWRVVAGAAAEWLAFLALYCLVMPFETWWMRGAPRRAGAPVMVLVHGYLCNRAVWWWQARHLRRAGIDVATLTLEPPLGDIEDFADQLHGYIEDLHRAGTGQVTLVGHSMGGLVARAYLRRYGATRVSRLVTLGTPHHGTRWAPLGLGIDCRQMVPGNPWLALLNAAAPPPLPVLSLWSARDAIVLPPSSSHWGGAREIVLPATGHLSMAFSRRVLGVLQAEASRAAPAHRHQAALSPHGRG